MSTPRTTVPQLAALALLVALTACDSKGPTKASVQDLPAAREVLKAFQKPDADVKALTLALRPTSEDYRAAYGEDLGKRLDDLLTPFWEKGDVVIRPTAEQSELLLWEATAEELREARGNAEYFPGGYKRAAAFVQGNPTILRFKFVPPGQDSGSAWDGLMHVNGRWILIPKPWRALKDGE